MKHAQLARELVRRLRGKRSQTAFSRRLGFATNVVYTWETGRRSPSASMFFAAAQRSGVDVLPGLRGFFGEAPGFDPPREIASRAGVTALLRALRREVKVAELARRTGTSRLTLSRWLEGQGEPRLPELLRLVDVTTQRLLDFVAVFADPATLASTKGAWRALQAQLRVAYELPWSHAVLRMLELEDLRARPYSLGRIASRLGISAADERECLQALAEAGQVRRVRGQPRVARVLTVDTRGNPAANRALKQHWASVALDRLARHSPDEAEGDLFSYGLFAVSDADHERIRQLHASYFEQLRAIVRASAPAQRLLLVNIQLVGLDRARHEAVRD